MVKKALPKARPKALSESQSSTEGSCRYSQKYGYLPPDLQRAGQHMERVAFLRSLQKSMADQNYVRTFGASSGLSEDGAVGLKEKVAAVAGEIAKPRGALLPARQRTPSPYRMPPLGPRSGWKRDMRAASERPRDSQSKNIRPKQGHRLSRCASIYAALKKGKPWRKPLGPFSIVPQFEDMLDEMRDYVKMPPENFVSDVLDDPIFQALGSMWNRIETSEELIVKHQANQVAFMQGASNSGVPIDVMRKLMERVVDQHRFWSRVRSYEASARGTFDDYAWRAATGTWRRRRLCRKRRHGRADDGDHRNRRAD
jgi:hypothetical protein